LDVATFAHEPQKKKLLSYGAKVKRKCLIGGCHVWPATKTEIKRWCLLLAMAANDALRLHIIIAAYERVTRGSYARGMLTQKEIH